MKMYKGRGERRGLIYGWNFGTNWFVEIDWFSFIYRAFFLLGISFLEFLRCPIEFLTHVKILGKYLGLGWAYRVLSNFQAVPLLIG